MRFSENGYYIERYVKCDNCGLLIYDAGIEAERHGKAGLYCSNWCVKWVELKDSGQEYFQLKIEHPTIKTTSTR